jgi:hypothetical protein
MRRPVARSCSACSAAVTTTASGPQKQGLVAAVDPADQKRRRPIGSMRFENHGPPGGAAVRAAFHDEPVAGMGLMLYPFYITGRSRAPHTTRPDPRSRGEYRHSPTAFLAC